MKPETSEGDTLMAKAKHTIEVADLEYGVRPAGAASAGAKFKGGNMNQLPARERRILIELAEGMTLEQIGLKLRLKPDEVNAHVESLYKKLGISGRAQAVIKAVNLGLVAW